MSSVASQFILYMLLFNKAKRPSYMIMKYLITKEYNVGSSVNIKTLVGKELLD